MARRSEKEVMEQLFEEMNKGSIKNYSEMQRRKVELLNMPANKSKRTVEVSVNGYSGYLSKVILIAVLITAAVLIMNFLGIRRAVTQTSYNGLNAEDEPKQSRTSQGEFVATYEEMEWKISPQADYKLVAKVQSKHRISPGQDSMAAIGKYDLALSWGKLVDSQYDKYIRYRQSGRGYEFNSSSDCPLSVGYISEHSANTHIIAANGRVLEGLEYIRAGDIVYMEGLLVNVFRGGEKEDYVWTTSLLRNDNSSEGGCEILYLKKLQIGSKTYE